MDESAIKIIQNTAIEADGMRARRLPESVVVLPKEYTIIDLEKYHEEPRRFTGTMKTSSLADFVAYVKARPGGEGFIEATSAAATVYFNLGDVFGAPGHGDHKAVLLLEASAAYRALTGIHGNPLIQRTIIDWLEDWAPHVQPYGYDGITPAKAIAALRQVTIKAKRDTETTHGDFKAARSVMDEVEASARVELPAGFTFRCEPYLGLPEREFTLRLSVLTSSDTPTLVLRIVRKEAEEEAIARDFKEVLLREVGDTATMTIGSFTR